MVAIPTGAFLFLRHGQTDSNARDIIIGSTDLDLGNRVLARLAIADGRHWRRANLVSNVVEYEAQEPNRGG